MSQTPENRPSVSGNAGAIAPAADAGTDDRLPPVNDSGLAGRGLWAAGRTESCTGFTTPVQDSVHLARTRRLVSKAYYDMDAPLGSIVLPTADLFEALGMDLPDSIQPPAIADEPFPDGSF